MALPSSGGLSLHSENLPDDDGLRALLPVFSASAETPAHTLGYGGPCGRQNDLPGARVRVFHLEAELYGAAFVSRAALPLLAS